MKYCNGAETFYTYDPQRRRLQNLTVNSGGNTIMDNAYTYDAVSNVLSVVNGASVPQSGKAGGQMAHTYTYDALYRLVSATGTYTGADNKTASYTLAMGYDNMHRITSKRQIFTQNNVQFNGTLNAGYDLSYTYGTETGKKFQLANVKDVNYRTEETPSESENVNNNHAYEYDANGNLVYVNTSRTKKDGMADEKTAERKLKWDEENRLLASDDNGFVTNYWYDADGERTVKTSGESDQVYVNSEFAGGRTNTAKFSLYVSPYLVANQGGRYTKHIYIGSLRVVSKIGDFASYGSDPRRIQYAGSETDGLSVDYKQKYVQQLQVIKDNYATFAVPYNGEDNNDYVDGKGFCCNDGSLEAAQTRALARAAKNNFQEGDTYEKMQFYYHPDHLGSSSYITNLDGEVVQHIEYVPFGEVFVEERNNIWNTPYLFNAKEFDEETGLYYYGARYYDPRISLWISTDNSEEKYAEFSSYCYVGNNPIILNDPNGNDWLRTDKKYFYDPSVTSQEDATNKYGKETKYLFAAGTLFAKSGAYSYDLEVGGHVKDSYTGEYIAGQFTTPAGSTVINNNQYLSSRELSFWEKMSASDNFFVQLAYGTLNDWYVCFQAFDFGLLEREEWKNPFTGANFGNLDGTPNYNQIDAIPGVISDFIPFSKAEKGLSVLKKMNAAQFSKTFKGTLSRLKPSTRGTINRGINSGIDEINSTVGSGEVMFDAIDFLKPEDKE